MREWQVSLEGDVAHLWRDDGKANALTEADFRGLEVKLAEIEAGPARAVILSGRPGFFCAGLDLKVLKAAGREQKISLVTAMGSAMARLALFPRPVVATVTGHALGAGAMLALAADLRFFADGSFKFGLNEVPLGLFVPSYAVELCRNAAPAERVVELCMHGRLLSPMESLMYGIAEGVHAPESLRLAAMMRAKSLATIAGPGYVTTKRLVREERVRAAQQRSLSEVAGLVELLETGP